MKPELTFGLAWLGAAGRMIVIGPPVVVTVTFGCTVIGNTSAAASPRGVVPAPTMITLVPAPANVPMTCMARVTVLKLHAATAAPPDMPLPVAATSLPFTGST